MNLWTESVWRLRQVSLGFVVFLGASVAACSSTSDATPTRDPTVPVDALTIRTATAIPEDDPTRTPIPDEPTPTLPVSPPGPGRTPTPSPTLTPTQTPVPLVVLRTAELQGWNTPLDPHNNTSEAFHRFFGNVYSGLVRWRTDGNLGPYVRTVEPDLAESWTQPNFRTFDFTLRANARWHDVDPAGGRLVTAGDVAFSIRRLFESEHRTLWRRVGSVTALDDSTVRITLIGSHPGFITQLASGFNAIVLPELISGNVMRTDSVVGTGPFVLDVAGSHFLSRGIANRNDEFYEPEAPQVDRIERIVVGEQQAAITMFRTGTIDYLAVGPSALGEVMDSRREIETFQYALGTGWALTFKQAPPFDNPRARRAANLSIDRAQFWTTYSRSSQPVAVGLGMPLPGLDAGLRPDEIDHYYTFDPISATTVLDEIGPSATRPFLVSIPDLGVAEVDAALGLVRGLSDVGFSAEPKVMSAPLYAAIVQAPPGLFEVALGPVGSPPESDLWLHERFGQGGAFNLMGHPELALGSLLDAQRTAATGEERTDALRLAQLHILEAAYQPMVFLDQAWIVANPGWNGWPQSFADEPFQRFLREIGPWT